MKLKRLELIGFKSFANKTSLEFLPGIVGIVGPNGSGKSNITDAIRWILGERESSHLRSAKIEDLIFAGTPKRPAMSLAQVNMHFDNSLGVIPVDFSEVAVTRRVGRDGVSEYYLNESRVRLRDIVDLFAKARLGVRGIAVINQGASDVFLRVSSDERREMIEEMLGLKEYRLKKNDAENKLTATEVNLQKAEALLEEIQPHLRFLRRQTNRFNKRQDVERELHDLERNYFLYQLKSIDNVVRSAGGRRAALEQELKAKRELLGQRKAAFEKSERHQPELLERLNALRVEKNEIERKRSELVRSLGKLEGKIEAVRQQPLAFRLSADPGFDPAEAKRLLHELHRHLGELRSHSSLERVLEIVNELHGRLETFLHGPKPALKETEEPVPHLAEAERQRVEVSGSIAAIEERLKAIIAEEGQFSVRASDTTKQFQAAYRLVEEANAEVNRVEHALNALNIEEERSRAHLDDFKTRIREAGWEYAALEGGLAGFSGSGFSREEEERMMRLRRELAAIGDIDEVLLNEAREVESRDHFLTEQIGDLRKAKDDTIRLIADLDIKIHEIFSGSLKAINDEFQNFFRTMFGGGRARLALEKRMRRKAKSVLSMIGSEVGSEDEPGAEGEGAEGEGSGEEEEIDESEAGIEIIVDLPRKKIRSVEMLSGGERSLVSIAALFALVAVSPPPFLVLDEVDAALDEMNAKRFANLLKELSKKTQFIVVTHNRVTMEAADALYGVTMSEDGVSQVLSLKLERV